VNAVVTVCVPLGADPTEAVDAAARNAGRPVDLRYEPSLLPPQRFPADHAGEPGWSRSTVDEERWRRLLAETTVAFGIPGDTPAGLHDLAETAHGLRWVQGTAAGTGELVRRADLSPATVARLTVTSAAGVHAQPLAEFALFGLLALAKDFDRLREAQSTAQWLPRWPMGQLYRSHVVVLGLGGIGREVARLCTAFGARVTGVRRRPDGDPVPGVERIVGLDDLDKVLPSCDSVVVALPGTRDTQHLLDASRLGLLGPHAVVVNVGRGSVVDSDALLAALEAGRLRGAVLDVTDPEPLPPSSPLWRRPDVVISPHTAALTVDEDNRLTDLFADNLHRWLTARPLRNVVDTNAGY
jgi:phosphoglycerate dehydrogenase-like enzyme